MKVKDLQIEYINAVTEEKEEAGGLRITQKWFEIGWTATIRGSSYAGSYTAWKDDSGKLHIDDDRLGKEFLESLLLLIPEYFRNFVTE